MSLELTRLAARAKAGDRSAFSKLVERFEAPLFQFLNLRSASREDAEELTQETFLRAWKYLDRYDPGRPFSAWLFTLGRHLSVSEHRKRRLRTGDPELLESLADPVQPAGIVSRREQGANLWQLARRVLSEDQYAALWLRYAEEVSLDGIARILGKRQATLRVILFRARARMARALEEETPAETSVRAPSDSKCYPHTGPLEARGNL